MSKLFSRLSLAMLAMLVVCLPQRQVAAQTDMELQPGIIISLTNLNEHLSDIEHLVEAAGFGQMKGLVRMGTAEYIRGIDPEKPMGAMLFFEGDNPEPEVLGFLPVTDIDDVLDTIAQFVDIDDGDDDIILTTDDGTELTVRVQEGYAYVTRNPEMLEVLPSDPANLLGDLPSEYNLAARVFGQRIPEALRNQMVDLIREGAEESMDRAGDGPEAELHRANFEYSMASIESLINDTDEVIAGMHIDEENERIYIDMKFVGTPDSRLAKQCAVMAQAPPTRFGGFLLDDAALNLHFSGKMMMEDVAQVQTMIEKLSDAAEMEIEKGVENEDLSEDEATVAKRILGDLVDVVGGCLDDGVMDMGAALTLKDDAPALAMGLQISNGSKLEATVKELAEIAESEDAPMEFRFDTANEDGIRYHEIDVLVPDSEEEAREMLGEKVKILLGVGDDVLYAAAGESGKELLDRCRQGSASGDQPAMQANVHLLPFLRFISKFQDSQEMRMVADALPEEAEDRMRMAVHMIENGQLVRMEIEDGILEIFGKIGQSMGGGGFGPPQDF